MSIPYNLNDYRPCVGLMLLNNQREVLAGLRLNNVAEAWQMPQGGIDPGEDPQDAVLREMNEEIGLLPQHVEILKESQDWIPYDLPQDLQDKLWGGRYRGQRQKWFALRFLGQDSDIIIETPEPEFREWRWMTSDQLIEKIVPFKKATYLRVFQEFADFL